MKWRTCKCGEYKTYGGMSHPACEDCEKCGTRIQLAGIVPREPEPHNWFAEKVMTDDGEKTITRCRMCRISKVKFNAQN